MPNGEVHFAKWKLGWLGVVPTSFVLLPLSPYASVGLLVGYGLGRWIDPDLDQITITKSESRMISDFHIVGWLLVAYSTIYGTAFRRKHRSFWTHFPFVSTAIRYVYWFWWIGLLYWKDVIQYSNIHLVFIMCSFFGLSIADIIHWALDKYYGEND